MTMLYYSICDRKVGYMAPWAAHNHEEAKRMFKHLAADKTTSIGQEPDDYELWHIGSFDDINGRMMGNEPEYLCNGREVMA